MLKTDEAQRRLATFRIPDRRDKVLAEIAKLPDKLRTLGHLMHQIDETGKPNSDWQWLNQATTRIIETFGKLSAKDRLKFFEVLFGKLAPSIEQGWQLRGRLPYQTHSGRRAYHAPGDDAAHLSGRVGWVRALYSVLGQYEPDLPWIAAWAVHISYYGSSDAVGILLATALDAGGPQGEEVFQILKDSATNQHEIGSMGRHIVRSMLCSSKPEAWEYIEKLLLAAQRQEGLRQVILETCDETHPEAFLRMLKLIVNENLLRFSSVVRAVDVWFGLQWTALTPAVLKRAVENAIRFLEDKSARTESIATADDESLFLALWASGYEDANKAVEPAVKLANDPKAERRYLAVRFLANLDLPSAKAKMPLFLDDADLRVVMRALPLCPTDVDLFDKLFALMQRMPSKPQTLPALIWPWEVTTVYPSSVADALVRHLGKRPVSQLLPYLPLMGYYGKREVVEKLKAIKKWDAEIRSTFFRMLGDSDYYLRGAALEALGNVKVEEAEAKVLEEMLSKKQSDMRRGVFTVLRKQSEKALFASIDRLLAQKKANFRLGALELMRQLVEEKKAISECHTRLASYVEKYKKHTDFELAQIEAIRDANKPKPTFDDALGLMNPAEKTKPIPPKARKMPIFTKAASECLKSLEALIDKHKETPVSLEDYAGGHTMLLGNLQYYNFPSHNSSKPREEELKRLPLAELWLNWRKERGPKLRDKDGYELLRAYTACTNNPKNWEHKKQNTPKEWAPYLDYLCGGLEFHESKYPYVIQRILLWLLWLEPVESPAKFVLDTLETAYTLIPEEDLNFKFTYPLTWEQQQKDWRQSYNSKLDWHNQAAGLYQSTKEQWSAAELGRWWELMHWRDYPAATAARCRPDLDVLLAGRKAGKASIADVYDQLLGPMREISHYSFNDLRALTGNPEHPAFAQDAELRTIVDRCRDRILEIELARGENPTVVSSAARSIQRVDGLDRLMQFIAALGTRKLKSAYYGEGRSQVFTHLIHVTHPKPYVSMHRQGAEDSPEVFKARVKEANLSEEFLLQLAFLAPQWLRHVEHTLGWEGLREAYYWFFGFESSWQSAIAIACDDERLASLSLADRWRKMIEERTQLSDSERSEGIIDVAWFHRVYAPLAKKKRWDMVTAAAKAQIGAKRALYASEVLLGKVKKADIVNRIKEKQSREAVRLLGLLPLAKGEKQEADVQGRYKVLLGYRKHARSLSPMGREGAMRDLQIGLANLARTAGYPDPVRLEWALEAKEIADLAAGPISITQDGVTVTLRLNEENQPEVTQRRGDKVLKAIPAPVRKVTKVALLLERGREIKKQASRIKQSLEAMMNRGDVFSGKELKALGQHALLMPLLERLVIVGEGIKGYPVAGGQALEDYNGKREPVKPEEKLRIAHCHDLFIGKDWDKWQADCFKKERVQPFKQVFRELYVVTEGEREDGHLSKRYAGQQVNPSQSNALFGSRLWGTKDEISKTFHEDGVVAEVSWRYFGGTPGEVEGNTFDTVMFRKKEDWKPIPLDQVPPRIFSEVMRDCDLVVSVAHVGGVDPEASASTVQMRLALVKETCALLKIKNYKQKGDHHLLIDGTLGQYSLHLGSGVVHKMPGGSVCIVPVHSQHRGRLFLPFADEDPRTAEVISKVLLLAKDNEIQDPNILDQLR